MRPKHVAVIACALLVVPCQIPNHVACAQGRTAEKQTAEKQTAEKEIEAAIERFFSLMPERDVEGLQAVLYRPHFLGIEASGQQAQAHLIHTEEPDEILPPEGNDDWDNVRISDVKVRISPTHGSVAMASFTLEAPLDARTIAAYKEMLKSDAAQLTEAQKKALSKVVDDGAFKSSMFAMLGRQAGAWRIVCITLPK